MPHYGNRAPCTNVHTKIGPTLRWGSPSLPPLDMKNDMKNVHATHNQHVYVYMSWHQNSTSFHAWKTWASSTVYIWTLSSTEHINHHNSYACKRHDDSENMHLKVGVSVLNLSNNMSKQRVQLHTKSFVENTQLLFGGKRTEKQRGGASSKPIWISLCWLHFFLRSGMLIPYSKSIYKHLLASQRGSYRLFWTPRKSSHTYVYIHIYIYKIWAEVLYACKLCKNVATLAP
jgi:hypothetical protein